MKFEPEQLLLYAVTDRHWTEDRSLADQVHDALEGGVTCVQLREKGLDHQSLLQEAEELKALCHQYKVPLIINDDWQLALECGADGVHVGIEDAPVEQIRAAAGPHFIIGATAKTVEQARQAELQGADYLGVGAVFPSPTKPGAVRITNEQLHEICTSVRIPAVAIGGIDLANVQELAGGGMRGIAVVSAIFAAKDITAASRQLKDAVLKLVEN